MRPPPRAVFVDDGDGGHKRPNFNSPLPERMVAVGGRRGPRRRLVVGHRVSTVCHGDVLVAIVRPHRPSGIVRLRVRVARLGWREGTYMIHLDLAAAATFIFTSRLVRLLRWFKFGALRGAGRPLSWLGRNRGHGGRRRRLERLPEIRYGVRRQAFLGVEWRDGFDSAARHV